MSRNQLGTAQRGARLAEPLEPLPVALLERDLARELNPASAAPAHRLSLPLVAEQTVAAAYSVARSSAAGPAAFHFGEQLHATRAPSDTAVATSHDWCANQFGQLGAASHGESPIARSTEASELREPRAGDLRSRVDFRCVLRAHLAYRAHRY